MTRRRLDIRSVSLTLSGDQGLVYPIAVLFVDVLLLRLLLVALFCYCLLGNTGQCVLLFRTRQPEYAHITLSM